MAAIRRPIALTAAVFTAAALGTAALALPALAAEQAPGAPKLELKDGTLDWGVKESFRKYVTGIAHGEIEVSDGARQADGNGPFTFTDGKGTYDTGTHENETAFKGSVRFSSKMHGFDITIADVKVRTDRTSGAIEADVTLNGTTQDDIELAALDLSEVKPGRGEGGAMTFADIPATLTADGAEAFNGMYKEGDALDAASLSVTAVRAPTTPPTSPDPTATATTSPDPTATATTSPDPTATATTSPKPTTTATTSPKPTSSPDPTTTATTSPDPTKRPTGEIVDGTLSWGLKESFRRYVTAGGEVQTAGGAKKTASGYDFPYAKADVDAKVRKVDASFDGSVRFLYQAHGIDMKFSDIKVKTAGAKGTLLLDVTTPEGTNDDVEFAALDLAKASYAAQGEILLLDKIPATLTADGARQFANETTGSPYKEGEAIDPVTVALALSDDAKLPDGTGTSGGTGTNTTGGTGTTTGGTGTTTGGTGSVGNTVGGSVGGSGSLASTGSDLPVGALAGAAGLVVAAGAGTVLLARRRSDAQG
ncbi:HtaA domain-containing protein [Streptomyces apocyni]|uniref:HtaA domain-containing protein n=1 Tax=Streptomyces apocyni TaxID=2654677 RepID=UPI0012EAE2A5|nr:HtaA domain-containing protein [Streptomyces apocyni]